MANLTAFALPFDRMLRHCHLSCPALLPELKRHAAALGYALEAFPRRFVLETLVRDERGGKLAEILARLENLHLLREAEAVTPQTQRSRNNKQQTVAALEVVRGGRANMPRSRLV